jgi:capsular exopolysaccharide synthesis family protein
MDSPNHFDATALRTSRVEAAGDTIELMVLARALWRRKYEIAAIVATVTVATLIAVSMMTPLYRATATLLLDPDKAQVVSFEERSTSEDTNNQYLETQAQIIRSRSLASAVVQTLNMTADPQLNSAAPSTQPGLLKSALIRMGLSAPVALQPDSSVLDRVTRQFMDRITVEPQGKSQLVKIQVDMADPAKAAQAANALVHGYINGQARANLGASETASGWMNGRLKELGEQLKDSETKLQDYREAQHLVDVQGVSTINAAELSQTSARMIDARRDLAEAQSQWRQVQGIGANDWEQLASVPAVMADPTVRQFKADQAKANARLLELSSRYGPRHPAVDAARSELGAATASLKSQVDQVVAGIERNYQLADANAGALKAAVDTSKSQIQNISRKEFQLQALQRDVDSNRALYDTFLNRLKETAATADIDSANIRVIDLAAIPRIPEKPNKPVIVTLVFLLATFLACAVALLRDALENTFRNVAQVQARLNLPVLGVVPLVKQRKRKDMAKAFLDHSQHHFSEAIGSIRTGMLLNQPKDSADQVIVVTSSVPGEGKTTLSINLARALGKLETVLLIDADLRRPSLADAFESLKRRPGLSNLIDGSATLAECTYSVDGMDVIGAGTATATPLELLSSADFTRVLRQLRSKYQRIIVDSPPVQAVSDAVVLSTLADSAILVIDSPNTSITLVQKAVAQLQQHRAPLRGVILNQIDIKASLRAGERFDGYYDHYSYTAKASA